MVEIRTAKNGTRFLFDHDGKNALVFIGERLHMTIVDVPKTDEDFQREIDKFMDSWNVANPTG